MSVNLRFEIEFPKMMGKLLSDVERGMGKAGIQMLTDATTEVPKTPHWRGVLRSSGSVFLQSKHIHTAKAEGPRPGAFIPNSKKESPTPATQYGGGITPDEITVVAGFNTSYAKKMHEGVNLNFKESGTGAKFLIMSMTNNGSTYLKLAAKEARR